MGTETIQCFRVYMLCTEKWADTKFLVQASMAAAEQARAFEVEARLAVRTAEERANAVRGRADSLRRAAAAERWTRLDPPDAPSPGRIAALRRRFHELIQAGWG